VINKRGALVGGGVVVLVVLAAALAWFGPLRDATGGDDQVDVAKGSPVADAADGFAAAWVAATLDKVPVTEASGPIAVKSAGLTLGLGQGVGRAPTAVEVTDLTEVTPPTTDGDPEPDRRVAADLAVTWTFGPGRTWTYDTTVELVEQAAVEGAEPVWLVDWTPKVVHPQLTADDELKVARVAASRGELLGTDGTAIVGVRPVVYVGIEPGATTDRRGAAQQVASIVGVDGAALADRVEAAGDGSFVSVITLRKEA